MLVVNFNTATPETGNSLIEVNFYDTTGAFDSSGYGIDGNPDIADVTAATITILPYLSTADPSVIDCYGGGSPFLFPNLDNKPFVILNTDLGLSADAPIVSGLYQVTYTVTALDVDYVTTKYQYFDAQHICCLDKVIARATTIGCADKVQLETLAISLQAKINSVHYLLSPNCDSVESANDIVKEINAICGSPTLGCGCQGTIQ